MLFTDSWFNLFTKRKIVYLYDINKSFIFSYFSYLAVDYVSNSDVEALYRKIIFNKVGSSFISFYYAEQRSEYVVFVSI